MIASLIPAPCSSVCLLKLRDNVKLISSLAHDEGDDDPGEDELASDVLEWTNARGSNTIDLHFCDIGVS